MADLRTNPGTRRAVERSFSSEGVATSTAAVPPSAEVQVQVEIEALAGAVGGPSIVVEGTITTGWTGACRRCLEAIEGEAEVELREVFEERPTDGETYPLNDDVVDLEPMVRDALLLALPLAPLCRPDCAGPAPEVFPTGPSGTEDVDPSDGSPDPRWSALDDLRFD